MVEVYTQNTSPDINAIVVPRDREMWDSTISPKIMAFARVFLEVLADPRAQDEYFRTKFRTAFLYTRMNAFRQKTPGSSGRPGAASYPRS